MRPIPHIAGLYLAVLQLVFALGWTVYAIYLPRLAASVGIPKGDVIFLLMLDQAVFTVTDFAMGVAADKVSRLIGRLGHWVAAITIASCAAFVALPFLGAAGSGPAPFVALTMTWAVTSSALRAPPLMLLGKYAARPAIPYLASLATLGIGIAGALSPYLATALSDRDPRLPFVIASVTLVLVSLALVKVERLLARQAAPEPEPPRTVDRAIPAPVVIFALAMVIFALGFQLQAFFNSALVLHRFTANVGALVPVFWIGFNVGMFPISLLTKRWGGLPVMGAAGLLGAAAIVLMELSGTLEGAVTAQAMIGAAWGCILMSAFAAAAAIGSTGAEGKTTGVLFSALAAATFARMAATASGILTGPEAAALVHWTPIICWAVGGTILLTLTAAYAGRSITAKR